MAKVKRTYRLEQDTVDKLGELSKADGVTVTEVLERAVMAYGNEPDESHTEGHTLPDGGQPAVAALSAELERLHGQLDVKDRQIERLADALSDAQATARAAQALHAMGEQRNALEDAPAKERRTRWQRLRDAWKG